MPSNPVAQGMMKPKMDASGRPVRRFPIPEAIRFKMALHRDLLLGNGFYRSLRRMRPAPSAVKHEELAEAMGQLDLGPKTLPVVNLLDVSAEHASALMEEALPADRTRLRQYLTARPLGLGAITAVSLMHNMHLFRHFLLS